MAKGAERSPGAVTGGSNIEELSATSGDIRVLSNQIGALGAKIDALTESVRDQGTKLDALRLGFAFAKGAAWVICALLAGLWAAMLLLIGKLWGH